MQNKISSFNFKQNFFKQLMAVGNLRSNLAFTLIVSLIAMTVPAWPIAVPKAEAVGSAYVSNLGQTNTDSVNLGSGDKAAQKFSTGDATDDYEFGGVKLFFPSSLQYNLSLIHI